MQKFRIVPSRKNMFWQLVQGMRLEEGDKALLREATIRHVEVCTRTNSWEIALSTQTLLPEALLESAADQIAKKCQLDAVVFYQMSSTSRTLSRKSGQGSSTRRRRAIRRSTSS